MEFSVPVTKGLSKKEILTVIPRFLNLGAPFILVRYRYRTFSKYILWRTRGGGERYWEGKDLPDCVAHRAYPSSIDAIFVFNGQRIIRDKFFKRARIQPWYVDLTSTRRRYDAKK